MTARPDVTQYSLAKGLLYGPSVAQEESSETRNATVTSVRREEMKKAIVGITCKRNNLYSSYCYYKQFIEIENL